PDRGDLHRLQRRAAARREQAAQAAGGRRAPRPVGPADGVAGTGLVPRPEWFALTAAAEQPNGADHRLSRAPPRRATAALYRQLDTVPRSRRLGSTAALKGE